MQKPSLGRVVHYTVNAADAEIINRRRNDFNQAEPGNTGFQAHVGNRVDEGDVFTADIVRVWNEDPGTVNLQVKLDGNDTYWATSRTPGEGPGRWVWPPRV